MDDLDQRSPLPGYERQDEADRLPDWFAPEVEAVLEVFRATGDPEDPSWRSLARQCVAAVWIVDGIWQEPKRPVGEQMGGAHGYA